MRANFSSVLPRADTESGWEASTAIHFGAIRLHEAGASVFALRFLIFGPPSCFVFGLLPAGFICTSTTSATMTACAAGTYSVGDATVCTTCTAGALQLLSASTKFDSTEWFLSFTQRVLLCRWYD